MTRAWTGTARLLAIGSLVTLLGLLLAGCGTDDGPDSAGSSNGSPDPDQQAAAPSSSPDATPTASPDTDRAPALGSIDEWHNSEPLSLDQLVGQPVLLVFWADF